MSGYSQPQPQSSKKADWPSLQMKRSAAQVAGLWLT